MVFSIDTDGTGFTLLHQFSGVDGSRPIGSLVVTPGGTLYGITQTGSTSNSGVLFSITKTGAYTVLHNFSLPVSSDPNALVLTGSVLVGSTNLGGPTSSGCSAGCGKYFDCSISGGQFATLYALPGSGADGNIPFVGSVRPGPTVYSIESVAIASLSQQSGFSPLANLNYYTVGTEPPSGPVYAPGGVLYGILGGDQYMTAVLYSEQNGTIQDLYRFGGQNGAAPIAKPFLTSSGSLIGTTTEDGLCGNCGTLWEYAP